jgi:hypothetical protein
MKTLLKAVALFCSCSAQLWAASTIDNANRYAYGANIGWIDCKADGANGAVIGESVCSGSIYSANCGWISLGSGTAANSIQYQNNSATDFGVNHDGLGNLRGYAYGANIGWINFENTGAPKVDLATGQMSGSVYGANVGWISLSNAIAVVQTLTIRPGADSDGDGIADAWELQRTNTLAGFGASSDRDGDGVSDSQEYLADTDPLDANSKLKITASTFSFLNGNEDHSITWTTRPTRFYDLHSSIDLNASWNPVGSLLSSAGLTVTGGFGTRGIASQRYFRVQALKPLSP